MQQFKFWLQIFDAFNSYSIQGAFQADSTVYTDSSDLAFGGHSATLDSELVRGIF